MFKIIILCNFLKRSVERYNSYGSDVAKLCNENKYMNAWMDKPINLDYYTAVGSRVYMLDSLDLWDAGQIF